MGSSAELEGCVVGGNAGVPSFEVLANTAVDEALLLVNVHEVVPQGKLGQSLQYLQGQWPKLIRYVENGAWPILNNRCHAAGRIMPRENHQTYVMCARIEH